MDKSTNIHELKEKVKHFCTERDWDKYHNAKELATGLVIEASELLEHFVFKSEEQIDAMFKDPKKKEHICEELADVLHYVVRFAQIYNIDLATELDKKMKKNALKYPVEKVKGSNKKYNED